MLFGTMIAPMILGQYRLPAEEVVVRFVDASVTSYGTQQNIFIPFDVTGGIKVESPITDLVSRAASHVERLPFLEIDEELDSKLSDFVRETYQDKSVRTISKRV